MYNICHNDASIYDGDKLEFVKKVTRMRFPLNDCTAADGWIKMRNLFGKSLLKKCLRFFVTLFYYYTMRQLKIFGKAHGLDSIDSIALLTVSEILYSVLQFWRPIIIYGPPKILQISRTSKKMCC